MFNKHAITSLLFAREAKRKSDAVSYTRLVDKKKRKGKKSFRFLYVEFPGLPAVGTGGVDAMPERIVARRIFHYRHMYIIRRIRKYVRFSLCVCGFENRVT